MHMHHSLKLLQLSHLTHLRTQVTALRQSLRRVPAGDRSRVRRHQQHVQSGQLQCLQKNQAAQAAEDSESHKPDTRSLPSQERGTEAALSSSEDEASHAQLSTSTEQDPSRQPQEQKKKQVNAAQMPMFSSFVGDIMCVVAGGEELSMLDALEGMLPGVAEKVLTSQVSVHWSDISHA